MNTADQLKRIKELLGAVTGFEDDDQQYVDDARDAVQKLIEALAKQPAQQEPEYKGWYCAHCQRGVDGSEVTYHEQHTVCGRVITDDMPPKAQQQEPVAWYRDEDGIRIYYESKVWDDATPLYTSPAQRTWVGLTDDEVEQACVPLGAAMLSFTEVSRAIEAKLKEKNT